MKTMEGHADSPQNCALWHLTYILDIRLVKTIQVTCLKFYITNREYIEFIMTNNIFVWLDKRNIFVWLDKRKESVQIPF